MKKSELKITESESLYDNIENMSIKEIIKNINNEDKKVAFCIEKAIPQVDRLISAAFKKLKNGGRLFYIGSGTSGRLGILDASECPPTFGVDKGNIIGIIAGGNKAVFEAVENAEDDFESGWSDLKKHNINSNDFVVGISSSGSTPYVVGAVQICNKNGIKTGAVTSNNGSYLAKEARYPVEVIVGPEFITGSTRMKSGTAQKMILNIISTTLMVKLGRISGNKMVDMQLKNKKLIDRGTRIIVEDLGIPYENAKSLLLKYKSVRKVLKKKSI
jgi:N-acetylmuramic acid 6-phosphate etherase